MQADSIHAAPTTAPPWRLWQLIDSAFPVGGFAHSGGLEAAHQAGLVPDADALSRFVLRRGGDAASGALVFVRQAWSSHDDLNTLATLDDACNAFLSNAIANRASRRQGRGLLSVAEQCFDDDAIDTLEQATRLHDRPGHWAVVFGVVAAALGATLRDALTAYLFLEARAAYSAAIRLNLTGPLDAQARLAAYERETPSLVEHALAIPLGEVGAASPLLDLAWGQQDRLYSKLFQS